jgi:hypothetical protein
LISKAVSEAGFLRHCPAAAAVDSLIMRCSAYEGYQYAAVGGISSIDVPGVGRLCVVYARDPDGNVLELQSWS